MKISNEKTNSLILEEFGKRIKRVRVEKNITRVKLAEHSGVSEKTIARLEQGNTINLDHLFSIMRTLELLENLDQLIPEETISPIKLQQALASTVVKKRAYPIKKKEPSKEWKWGDEE